MLGWSARIWSHYDVIGYGFIVQTSASPLYTRSFISHSDKLELTPRYFHLLVALIIAPTLFSGALYEMFEVMVRISPRKILLRPLTSFPPSSLPLIYQIALVQPTPTWIHAKRSKTLFATTDFLSVGLQLAGGGYTARATTQHQLDTGAYIIAAGILWQLLIMVGFVGVAGFWWWDVRKGKGWKELTTGKEGEGEGRMGKMLIGGLVCSVAIIIRGVSWIHEEMRGKEN